MVKLIYGVDQDGEEILTDTRGEHQVMMAWEKEYMEFCVDKLQPYGRVLEVGFGLGYSARHIQTFPGVTEHVIIECAPAVWEHMDDFLKSHSNVSLVKGRWQDVLYTCGQFDCVFFDDYDAENTLRRAETFRRELVDFQCLKIGSRIMFYSSSPGSQISPSLDFASEPYSVKIPTRCKYATGDKMYAIKETVLCMPVKLPPLPTQININPIPAQRTLSNARVALGDAIYNMHCLYRDRNMIGLAKNTQSILNGGYTMDINQRHEVEFYHAYSLFSSDPEESKSILMRLDKEMDTGHELHPFIQDNLNRITSNRLLQE